MPSKKPKMVQQKRRRSSVAELREQESQTQANVSGKNMGEPDQNNSIYGGRAALYLNPNLHSLYVPSSSQDYHTDHSQNSSFPMQVANDNCPSTIGYTTIPSFSSHPCYGTPDNANAYHPTPSLWQTRSDPRTYTSVNPVCDHHYPEVFENASIYPCYHQPWVQTNFHHMAGPSHECISLERQQLSHSSPQSISQLQVTSFASANANTPPQEQEQPAQNEPVQCPREFKLPCAPKVGHQGASKRARKFWSKLKASSGIVNASQLQPGQSPSGPVEFTKPRRAERVRNVSCPICGGLFATPYHIQGHFPACVRRNGNPDGLFWDETLPLRWRRYGKCDTNRDDKLD